MAKKDEATLRLRRRRRLRDLRNLSVVFGCFAGVCIVLMLVGFSPGRAAAWALLVAMVSFFTWVFVDGYRAARRSGKAVLASMGVGLREVLELFISLP